jgi:hypothetical protein
MDVSSTIIKKAAPVAITGTHSAANVSSGAFGLVELLDDRSS